MLMEHFLRPSQNNNELLEAISIFCYEVALLPIVKVRIEIPSQL